MRSTATDYDRLPAYPSLISYPNNRSAHLLRRFKNGTGLCSCEQWVLEGASEASLIASHQLHIFNLPITTK